MAWLRSGNKCFSQRAPRRGGRKQQETHLKRGGSLGESEIRSLEDRAHRLFKMNDVLQR